MALKLLALALFVGAVVWGVGYASYLSRFTVQSINVTGTHSVAPELVRNYAWTILDDGSRHYLSRTNIFLYPRTVLERAIVGYFPRIASASVSRPSYLSNELDIEVREREAFALWCREVSVCYDMDEGGFIFSEHAATSSVRANGLYVFRGGVSASTTSEMTTPVNPVGSSFATAHLPGLVVLLRLLGQAGFTPLGATLESGQDFSIPLAEGFTLKASFGSDAGTLTRNLDLVLSSDALQGKKSELEYVDLRFGNRVYYKLKGEAQTTAQ